MPRNRAGLLGVLLVGWLACSGGVGPEDPPNIVLIIGDDVGWTDFGFMGSKDVLTPNLDRLAAEGMVFTRAMSSASTCKPALRTLLTGLDPAEVGRLVCPIGIPGIADKRPAVIAAAVAAQLLIGFEEAAGAAVAEMEFGMESDAARAARGGGA